MLVELLSLIVAVLVYVKLYDPNYSIRHKVILLGIAIGVGILSPLIFVLSGLLGVLWIGLWAWQKLKR